MYMRLQVLEQQQSRMKGQLDFLTRMLQSVANPPISAQAGTHSLGSDPDMNEAC